MPDPAAIRWGPFQVLGHHGVPLSVVVVGGGTACGAGIVLSRAGRRRVEHLRAVVRRSCWDLVGLLVDDVEWLWPPRLLWDWEVHGV